MNWSDEEFAALKELWAEGKSCRYIGELLSMRFRRVISRNSVISKANRCVGLERRRSANGSGNGRPRRSMRRQTPPPPGLKSAMRAIWANAPSLGPSPMPKDDDPHAHPDRKTLADLEDNECRWPLGDPKDAAFGFCGHVKAPGLSYCPTHAMRAYAPTKLQGYDPGERVAPRLRKLRPVKLEEVL